MSDPGLIVTGLVLAAAAMAFAWLAIEFINRRPAFGAFALFLWLGALVFAQEQPELFVRSVGGVNVTVPDVLCAFLGLVAALRFFRQMPGLSPDVAWPLLVFSGVLALSFARGVSAFGVQHATNEFREFFYFLTALAFSVSFPFSRLAKDIPLVGVMGGSLLMAVALVRLSSIHQLDIEHRPLPSYAALAIGEAFFLGWFWLRGIRGARYWQWLVLSFLPFSFFMLHRSVWICLLTGLAGLLVFDARGRKKLLSFLAIGGVGLAIGVGLFFQEKIARGLDGAVTETTSEDSTFVWRLEGWVALLSPDSDVHLFDLMAGRPMGSGYARRLGDSVLNTEEIEAGVIPHNYFVSVFLRGGIAGLAAFVLLYAALLKNLFRSLRQDPDNAYAASFLVILLVQLAYYIPYSADFIQGLLLGGAITLCAALRSREPESDFTYAFA